MTGKVFPELIHGRRDGFEQGPWKIERGTPQRGGASCNLTQRILRVPDGIDDMSRVVRAHELMHVRVSPHRSDHTPEDPEIASRALECAEEYRVNWLLKNVGFDISLLCDGTERLGGQRVAENAQWSEAVCFFLAVMNTGAEAPFVKGIRAKQPSWPVALRAIKKRVLQIVSMMDLAIVGDTTPNDDGIPHGYGEVTIPIARLVSRAMAGSVPESPEALRLFRRSLEPGGRRPPSGVFAPLVFDETLSYRTRPARPTHRKSRPSVSGTAMRFPSRLLTDPLQRAFVNRSSHNGGVIVIDQSGSMDVTDAQLENMLNNAPNALIVGYSHRPGDTGHTPNAWVLAREGRVATTPRPGNIGNGVDGPVLRWALQHVRPGEPVIWVTDGQVTDSHDHPCHSLSLQCASLVRRHKIRLVKGLDEVESALRGRSVTEGSFGRVGRELRNLRST